MRFEPVILALALISMPLCSATLSGTVAIERDHAAKSRVSNAGVVLWFQPMDESVAVQPRRAVMLQKNKTFSPHLLVIGAGSSVEFPNLDPIFHNAFSSFDGQVFDVALYPPGTSRTVSFSRTGIVRVFCNIHPSMSAIILVLATPYWSTSNAAGAYSIGDIRPGAYMLNVFHERSTPETLSGLRHRVTIDEGANTLPAIHVSESGYVPLPHKNKYGRDYPVHAADEEYAVPQ